MIRISTLVTDVSETRHAGIGGEATAARTAVTALPTVERDRLLAFFASL